MKVQWKITIRKFRYNAMWQCYNCITKREKEWERDEEDVTEWLPKEWFRNEAPLFPAVFGHPFPFSVYSRLGQVLLPTSSKRDTLSLSMIPQEDALLTSTNLYMQPSTLNIKVPRVY